MNNSFLSDFSFCLTYFIYGFENQFVEITPPQNNQWQPHPKGWGPVGSPEVSPDPEGSRRHRQRARSEERARTRGYGPGDPPDGSVWVGRSRAVCGQSGSVISFEYSGKGNGQLEDVSLLMNNCQVSF